MGAGFRRNDGWHGGAGTKVACHPNMELPGPGDQQPFFFTLQDSTHC